MVATLPPDIPEPGLSWIEVGQWRNWSYEPLLENTININFHLARKYVRIFFSGQSLSQGAKLEVNSELRGTDNVQGQIYENFFCYKWRVLYLVSVLKLTHPLLLTRFFKIYFVVIRGLKKKMYPFLCYQIYKKKQFNKGQILKVNGLVQTGKGKWSFSFRETNKCFLLIM